MHNKTWIAVSQQSDIHTHVVIFVSHSWNDASAKNIILLFIYKFLFSQKTREARESFPCPFRDFWLKLSTCSEEHLDYRKANLTSVSHVIAWHGTGRGMNYSQKCNSNLAEINSNIGKFSVFIHKTFPRVYERQFILTGTCGKVFQKRKEEEKVFWKHTFV